MYEGGMYEHVILDTRYDHDAEFKGSHLNTKTAFEKFNQAH